MPCPDRFPFLSLTPIPQMTNSLAAIQAGKIKFLTEKFKGYIKKKYSLNTSNISAQLLPNCCKYSATNFLFEYFCVKATKRLLEMKKSIARYMYQYNIEAYFEMYSLFLFNCI